jgi:hypothetical protein
MIEIVKGVARLDTAESVSVCLPPGFRQCLLSVTRAGNTKLLAISRQVAAELIAAGFPFQG